MWESTKKNFQRLHQGRRKTQYGEHFDWLAIQTYKQKQNICEDIAGYYRKMKQNKIRINKLLGNLRMKNNEHTYNKTFESINKLISDEKKYLTNLNVLEIQIGELPNPTLETLEELAISSPARSDSDFATPPPYSKKNTDNQPNLYANTLDIFSSPARTSPAGKSRKSPSKNINDNMKPRTSLIKNRKIYPVIPGTHLPSNILY
jgi:hypothetical protein